MREGNPRSTDMVDGRALLPIVAPFPFACFAGALINPLYKPRSIG